MANADQKPTALHNADRCLACGLKPKNRAELPCGHSGCYQCIKKLGSCVVNGKKSAASCPVCMQSFLMFWHTSGRSYTFYRKGHGAKGKLQKSRRHRVRRRRQHQAPEQVLWMFEINREILCLFTMFIFKCVVSRNVGLLKLHPIFTFQILLITSNQAAS